MDSDTVYHQDVIKRAAKRQGVPRETMRKHVANYIRALGSYVNEADPVRSVRMANFGVLRIKTHKGHKFNAPDGSTIDIPDYRTLQIDAEPRLEYVLKAPLNKFYDPDEYKS